MRSSVVLTHPVCEGSPSLGPEDLKQNSPCVIPIWVWRIAEPMTIIMLLSSVMVVQSPIPFNVHSAVGKVVKMVGPPHTELISVIKHQEKVFGMVG